MLFQTQQVTCRGPVSSVGTRRRPGGSKSLPAERGCGDSGGPRAPRCSPSARHVGVPQAGGALASPLWPDSGNGSAGGRLAEGEPGVFPETAVSPPSLQLLPRTPSCASCLPGPTRAGPPGGLGPGSAAAPPPRCEWPLQAFLCFSSSPLSSDSTLCLAGWRVPLEGSQHQDPSPCPPGVCGQSVRAQAGGARGGQRGGSVGHAAFLFPGGPGTEDRK